MQSFVVQSDEIEGRLDADFYKTEFRKNLTTLRGIYFKELGEMVEFSNETWDQKSIYNDKFPYIEISEIDITSGEIRNIIYYEKERAPSRAKMIVRENDIIVSTTRPHRGAISLIDESKNSYIASTGFAVLRGLKTDEVSRDFLFHILKTNLCLNQMLQRSSGGNYPAITTEDLKKIKIPFPPLSIQNQIVEIMQSAYEQKKQKEAEAQRLLDSIDGYVLDELGIKLPEVEDKMFFVVSSYEVKSNRVDAYYYQPRFEEVEEALRNGKYTVESLKNRLNEITSGQRPKGGVKQISDGVPSLGGEHILGNGCIATQNLKFIPNNFHEFHLKSKANKNDILLVKDGATTGKVGIIPQDYPFDEVNINEHVFLIRCKKDINPYYLFSFLKSTIGQIQISREITGGTIMGIVRVAVENLSIPLPPLEIQNKIADEVKRRISEAERLKTEASKIIEEAKKKVEKMILGGVI